MSTPAVPVQTGTPGWMIAATALVGVATVLVYALTIYLYVVAW